MDLISGATGQIGQRLLANLRANRRYYRALSRTGVPDRNFLAVDLADKSALAAACDGIECVFHCAGYAHAFASSDPDVHWRINFECTRNLLETAGEAGVRRFVFLSSVKAMAEPGDVCAEEDWPGDPVTPYGRSKKAAEDAVLEAGARYGMHVVNLRLAMVYCRGGRGNLERMARGIRAGWFPPLPETGNRRSLVYVDDVVAAMRLVAESPAANCRTYIVADSRAYSGREIYDAIRVALGMAPIRWRIPAALLRAGGYLGDGVGKIVHHPLLLNSEGVERLLGSACYSPARIERELGWQARIDLVSGLRMVLGPRR